MAFFNFDSHVEFKEVLKETVELLSRMVEYKDPYTAGHQKRVADIAYGIADKLDLSEKVCETVYIAGLLHDIGKIAIPGELLTKPGKLDIYEFDLIKRHPVIGYEILNGSKLGKMVAKIILYHHERMDGSGYPEKLSGFEIPMESRIIAVADVMESVTSHRPYRSARGKKVAFGELLAGSGSIYDKDVVDACLEILKD